jgi:hypothetical protein
MGFSVRVFVASGDSSGFSIDKGVFLLYFLGQLNIPHDLHRLWQVESNFGSSEVIQVFRSRRPVNVVVFDTNGLQAQWR